MTETISLGCRLNIAESDAIAAALGPRDDLIVVNSCAVTNEAVRRTRQLIRQAHKRRPDARIVVTGCAAQVEPERFAAMPEVARVIGNGEKADAALYAPAPDEAKIRVSDIMQVRETAPHLASSFSDRARAFLEVQNGCDHRCTFCIIPFGRGNSRSVPAGACVERAKALVGEGFREIVLTGVDVTSYGADLPGSLRLGSLVERILRAVPDLPRLRLSSLDGIEVDDRLFDLITQHERVMPHIHLSLQAGDDMILKRMKRRHSRAQAIDLVQRLKAARPDIAIGADIIAGFPTESDAMFANSLKIVEECDIVHGHIFPYSARTGTPAARMPQVHGRTIKARAKMLRDAVTARHDAWQRSLVGSVQQILVEHGGHGHAPNFAKVRLPTPSRPSGEGRAVGSHKDGADDSVPRRCDGDGGPYSVGAIVPLRIAAIENTILIGDTP